MVSWVGPVLMQSSWGRLWSGQSAVRQGWWFHPRNPQPLKCDICSHAEREGRGAPGEGGGRGTCGPPLKFKFVLEYPSKP